VKKMSTTETPVEISSAEQAQFDAQQELAEQAFTYMQETSEAAGADAVGVGYALFVTLARFLTDAGWTADELMRDVGWHSADHGSAGRA
jgi:hypothetical protein